MRRNEQHNQQAATGRRVSKRDEKYSGRGACVNHTLTVHEKELTDVELMNGTLPKGPLILWIVLICGVNGWFTITPAIIGFHEWIRALPQLGCNLD